MGMVVQENYTSTQEAEVVAGLCILDQTGLQSKTCLKVAHQNLTFFCCDILNFEGSVCS